MRKLQKLSKGKEIKRLDRYFSKYIRQKHADKSGQVKCATCNERGHWKEFDNGHYIKRGCHLTRFEETNVAPQCIHCNHYCGGESGKFAVYIIDTYGRKELDRLHALETEWKRTNRWIRTPEIRELTIKYKTLLEQFK